MAHLQEKHEEKLSRLEGKISRLNSEAELQRTEYQVRIMELERQVSILKAELRQQSELRTNELNAIKELLPKPFEKIVPELDLTTRSIANATIEGNLINADKGIKEGVPFFLTRKLEGRLSFELELVSFSSRCIKIGVAADTLRNTVGSCNHPDALYLHVSNGTCPCDRKAILLPILNQKVGLKILVAVDMQAREVEWVQVHPYRQSLMKTQIPIEMFGKALFPVLHLWCGNNNIVKFA